jgi:hypothetical protein
MDETNAIPILMGETMIVVGFVAPSGTGKTTLVRQVVAILDGRGLRVGYLKHAHHRFDLDVPGKDSYEVREAGARQTLLASKTRWALQVQNPVQGEDPDLYRMLSRLRARPARSGARGGLQVCGLSEDRGPSSGDRASAALPGGPGHHRRCHRRAP